MQFNNLKTLSPGDMIQIKLSRDGTSIGRNINVVKQSSSANDTLGILRVPEKYDSLVEALHDISIEAENL